MSCGEQAKKEIATIAPRTITLNLSDTDCPRLSETAGQVGMSAGELLQAFIGDLVDGTYTNGSDERMYTQMWFDRCGFAQMANHTLLRYLLERGDMDDFLCRYSILKECEEDLLAAGPFDPPEANREEIEFQRSWLQEEYDDYTRVVQREGHAAESFDEALARVLQWRDETYKLRRPAQQPGREAAPEADTTYAEPEYEPELG